MAQDDKEIAIFSAYEDEQVWDPTTPEKNLLRAMLLTAMADLRKTGDVGRQAREYFLSNENDYLFSFRSVCDYLNVDPRAILVKVGLESPSAVSAVRPDQRYQRLSR